MQSPRTSQRYAFESFCFDAATGKLRIAGRSVKLRPQVCLALDLLLARQGDVVTREELRQALWPDDRLVMFEASIAAVIRELRRALDDNPQKPVFIETIPKRGYRFLPPVKAAEPVLPARPSMPTIRRRGSSIEFLRISAALTVAAVMMVLGGTEAVRPRSSWPADPGSITVVVLPFQDLTRAPGHGSLAETVPGDLVGWLGPLAPERLRVIDRTGVSQVSAHPSSGEPADFFVRGSVRDDRGAFVISVRLLSGTDGAFVWGEDYRRSSEDAGLTAREVAARMADGLVSASLAQWKNAEDSPPAAVSGKAATAYHRGMKALARLDRKGAIEAAEAFREATELDPGSAAAHARLGEALISWTGPTLTADRIEQARQAAILATELDERNAVAHRVLGEIGLYGDLDWALAGRHLKRSVEFNPSDAAGHQSHAAWLSARGHHDEALREIDLARALDPGSVAISIDVMLMHFYARDFEETVSAARHLQQLWPGNEASHRYIVLSRLATDDIAGAATEARARLASPTAAPDTERSVSALADSEALEAYWTASLGRVAEYVHENSGDRTALAMLYVQADQVEAAINELEAAVASRRFSYLLPYLGVSPAFDKLCGQPRFKSTLRRLDQAALGAGTVLPRCAAAIPGSSDR